MTPSVRTLQGSKTKGFQGSTPLCPRGSNARGFSNYNVATIIADILIANDLGLIYSRYQIVP